MAGVTVQIDAKDKSGDVLKGVGKNFTNTFDKIDKAGKKALGDGGGSTRISAGGISGTLAGIPGFVSGAAIAVGKLAGGLWDATRPAREFEKTMSQVEAIMRPTTKQLVAMEAEAKRLGASTSFTATQSAEAYVKLGQAGLSASESIEALEPVLLAAEAGGLKLAEAADIGTNIMGQMGLSVKDLDHVMDGLAKAATSSNTDVRELAGAFKYGGQVARLAGLDFDETTAALSLLSNEGLKGSSAGTALSNALIKMQKPSEKATIVMEKLGLEFMNVDGSMRPLPDIVDDVAAANLSAKDAAELFGQRGLRAMSALGNQGGDALKELTGAINTSDGAAKKMAKTMLDNVDGSVIKFQSALEGLKIALFEGANPALQQLIDYGTSLLSSATAWVQAIKNNEEQMKKWIAILIQVKDQFVFLWELIENGVQGAFNSIRFLTDGFKGLIQIFKGDFTEGVKNMGAAWDSFKEKTKSNNMEIATAYKTMEQSRRAATAASELALIDSEQKIVDEREKLNRELMEAMGITPGGGIGSSGMVPDLKRGTEQAHVAITSTVSKESTRQGDAIRSEVDNVIVPAWDDMEAGAMQRHKNITSTVSKESTRQGSTIKSEVNNVIVPAWDDMEVGAMQRHRRITTAVGKESTDQGSTIKSEVNNVIIPAWDHMEAGATQRHKSISDAVEKESTRQGDAIRSEVDNVIIPAWDDVFGSVDDHYKKLTEKSPLTGGEAANALTMKFGANVDDWLADESSGFKSKWRGSEESAEGIAVSASRHIGSASQKVFMAKFGEGLKDAFEQAFKRGLGDLLKGDFRGFLRGVGGTIASTIMDNVSSEVSKAVANLTSKAVSRATSTISSAISSATSKATSAATTKVASSVASSSGTSAATGGTAAAGGSGGIGATAATAATTVATVAATAYIAKNVVSDLKRLFGGEDPSEESLEVSEGFLRQRYGTEEEEAANEEEEKEDRETGESETGFSRGGLVPGRPGQARGAVVHGGEGVLTRKGVETLGMLNNGQMPGGGGGGTIVININGQDSESAQQLAEKIIEEIRTQSYQGNDIVYDRGVVNTGAAA